MRTQPKRSGSWLSRTVPCGVISISAGPQAGHALGCAWKRRSSTRSYSSWQAAHIVNAAIVVRARSYGASRAIVNRGPQFVQLVNGYRYRRSAGSRISCRHAAHVARSGGMEIRRSDVVPALDDRERVEPLRRDRLRVNLANLGGSRRGTGESVDEIVECFRRSERVNRHACGVVADAPGHAFLGGKAVDPGTEADPLHHPANLDAASEYRHRASPSDST